MKTVFVSGCYDLLHAGHLQFFSEARALGDHLTVCFASEEVLWKHKRRKPSLPDEHKQALLEGLCMVDRVVLGSGDQMGMDFEEPFRQLRPDILAVTEDDQFEDRKRGLCEELGAQYRRLPKTPPRFQPISTTQLVRFIQAPTEAPLRVDFGGGWLDVPRLARPQAYIVNCAISPCVSLRHWPYERNSGLGGSGAWALINGQDGVDAELDLGVGWQDPAVITETGLCVWRSGPRPVLDFKRNGDLLAQRMALLWTGKPHDTPNLVAQARDYDLVEEAGRVARDGVLRGDVSRIGEGVQISYRMQRGEGMAALPEVEGAIAYKYCGGGWGGYAVFLFDRSEDRAEFLKLPDTTAIEPVTL